MMTGPTADPVGFADDFAALNPADAGLDEAFTVPAPDPEPLEPDDIGEATRVAGWLRSATAALARDVAPFDEEIAKLVAARDDVRSGHLRRIDGLEAQLKDWHQAVMRDDPSRKTIKLPYVTLAARAGKGRFEIEDRGALIDWCQEHSPAATVEVTATKLVPVSELRYMWGETDTGDVVTGDGQVVPGVTVEGAGSPTKVTVRP